MPNITATSLLALTVCLAVSCQAAPPAVQYHKWTVSGPILTHGPDDAFDNIAVKDPSIFYHNGNYHLFYTSKSGTTGPSIIHPNVEVPPWKYGMSIGYVAAPSLDQLRNAPRTDLMHAYPDLVYFDPHVFYFEPRQQWYMVMHKRNPGRRPNILPFYMTSQNIEDPNAWSAPRELKTAKSNDEFWIDFWVICDDKNAHMFYANQRGSVFRMQCPLDQFPHGFANASEVLALTATGQDDTGHWLMFEGAQVYHVKHPDQYLFIGECKYDTGRDPMVDAKRRFIIAMTAPTLEGPWTRLEQNDNDFFIQSSAFVKEDGSPCKYSQVSLPGLIRSYNQTFDIDNYNITMLFQAFDGSKVPDSAHYNELPWELALMKNH